MMVFMDSKTWLVEAEVTVCLMGLAAAALTLMVGYILWQTMGRILEH